MGLRYGPLEDVAAIALGKVQMNGGRHDELRILAIESLGRFREDPRFFDTMTEITRSLWQANEPAPKDRTSLSEGFYFRAVLMLTIRLQSLPVETRDRIRDFLIAQFEEQANPWPRYAFLELSSEYKEDRSVQSLVAQILGSPQKDVFLDALHAYAEFTPKRELLARLSAMEKDPKYSPGDKVAIRKTKEEAMHKPSSKEKR
jgi:hypothetical protein